MTFKEFEKELGADFAELSNLRATLAHIEQNKSLNCSEITPGQKQYGH